MTAFVLLPGMDGTGKLFDAFVAALGADHQITVVSYPSDASLGYGELEAVARAALPVDRRYVLLAESFGPHRNIDCCLETARARGAGVVLHFCALAISLRALDATLGARSARLACAGNTGRVDAARAPCDVGAAQRCRSGARSSSASRVEAASRRVACDRRSPAVGVHPSAHAAGDRRRPDWRAASLGIAAALPQPQIQDLDAPHFLLQVQPRAAAEAVLAFASPLTD